MKPAVGLERPPGAPFSRPYMPPLDSLRPYLEQIWADGRLTDCGPFHQQLEQALAEHLGVEHLVLTVNGTIGMLLTLQALDLEGEVITTPFSCISNIHALRWSRLRPVFVDIDPATGNLDPQAVEAAITPRTRAILPVHCFGHPCDVDRLAGLADLYGLRLIYDAAQAFGVALDGRSLLAHGDASVLSFHADMLFNSFEGGAVVCADARLKRRIARLRHFGLAGEMTVVAAGINGQMNEFQAAFGLLQLDHIDHVVAARARVAARYRAGLAGVTGLRLFAERPQWGLNHACFPLAIDDAHFAGRNAIHDQMVAEGIGVKRLFYPLTAETAVYRDLPSARGGLAHARQLAQQILCLPLYPDLPDDVIDRTIALLAGA